MGNSSIHDHDNLPILVAVADGRMKGNQHIRYKDPEPLRIFTSRCRGGGSRGLLR